MLLPLFLYFCWEGVQNIWMCVPSTFLCIFVWRGLYRIYEGALFDQRSSVSLLSPVFDPLSSLSLLGEHLCWKSGSVCLLRERETASDQIYEGRVFDQCSTQLALHNPTSNHVRGKEALSFDSNYLNILDACLFFIDLCFTSSIFVIFVLKYWL